MNFLNLKTLNECEIQVSYHLDTYFCFIFKDLIRRRTKIEIDFESDFKPCYRFGILSTWSVISDYKTFTIIYRFANDACEQFTKRFRFYEIGLPEAIQVKRISKKSTATTGCR